MKQVKSEKRGQIALGEVSLYDLHRKTNVDTSDAPSVVVADRINRLYYDPSRTEHVRDLLPGGQTVSNALTFPYEATITDNTAVAAESSLKGQSSFTMAIKTWNVYTIATFLKISNQMLDDIPALRSYLSARFMEKLMLEEDTQFMYSATSNQTGLTVNATAYTDELADSTINRYDVLRMAIKQARVNEYRANAIILHPTDAAKLELTKEASTGAYIFPYAISGEKGITVARVPILETTAITEGDFLVGDFRLGAQVFDRMAPSIGFYEQDETNVQYNLTTVRIEERVAMVVYAAKAFIYGDFASALAKGSA
jgi:HK97 family phage major capsid protein